MMFRQFCLMIVCFACRTHFSVAFSAKQIINQRSIGSKISYQVYISAFLAVFILTPHDCLNAQHSDLEALMKQIHNSDIQVRCGAIQNLGMIGDSTAVPALIHALKDPDELVRGYVVEALSSIGQPTGNVIPALLDALDDKDPEVRLYAAEGLGKIGEPVTIPELIQALDDPNESVAAAIAQTLQIIGQPSLTYLVPALNNEKQALRYWVAWTLDNIIPEVGFVDQSVETALKATLSDISYGVRIWAASALYKLNKLNLDLIMPILIEGLTKEHNIKVRRDASVVVGHIGSSAQFAIPHLLQELEDIKDAEMPKGYDYNDKIKSSAQDLDSLQIQFYFSWTLGMIGDPAAIPTLVRLLKDPAYGIRTNASEALYRIGLPSSNQLHKDVTTALLEVLQDEENHWTARANAALALGEYGKVSNGVVPVLINLLNDDIVADYTIEALGEIGAPMAVPPLIALLDDESYMEETIINALKKINTPEAKKAIAKRTQTQ
ncbi:MAG: HEAT repeat domain-containing protein [Candidatus Poribacteria bacterium]|nr:HEAT repeat domain-containing protein [Candidatus Poribacteria bacterium]